MDRFTIAYIEAAFWSSTDNSDDSGGDPLDDHYGIDDLSPETIQSIIEDCQSFQNKHFEDIKNDLERAGHDFWLTRNGHGAGFWDGDWDDEIGRRLTEASDAYGCVDLYIGDDGFIYS